MTGLDSETWTCAGPCHGQFIGHRPADDTCPECTVLQATTEPAAPAAYGSAEHPAHVGSPCTPDCPPLATDGWMGTPYTAETAAIASAAFHGDDPGPLPQHMQASPGPVAEVRDLIEASSLGTPGAKALRDRADPAVTRQITDRAAALAGNVSGVTVVPGEVDQPSAHVEFTALPQAAALAGTGLVVPSGQTAEPPSGCTCAGAECTRGEFRDHQGDSPGCMACADLDPDQPCFAASGQAAELDGTEQDPERAAYTAGLRQLADLLDAHPEAKLPYDGTGTGLLFQPRGASEVLSTARALGCQWTASEWDAADKSKMPFFQLDGELAGLKVELLARRDDLEPGLAALRAEFGRKPGESR